MAAQPTTPYRDYLGNVTDEAVQAQIEQNLGSLVAIPQEQCPWAAVRSALLRWAIHGADIYAYTPHGSDRYVIYMAQEKSWMQCRFTPAEWAARYGYDVSEPTDSKERA